MDKQSSLLKLDRKRKRVVSGSSGGGGLYGGGMSRKEARLAKQIAAKPDEEVAVQ